MPQSFAKRSSTAAIGARAAEDELVDVEQVENEVCAQGVASATTETFEEFRAALTPTGKICADLFAQTHGGGFNVDFLEIANAEARSASFSFPWPDLFQGKAEEKVGGISVPSLHAACLKWIASTLSQPTATNSTSAIGDADRTLATATTQGADHAEEKARANTIAKLEEMLQKMMTLLTISEYATSSLTHVYRAAKEKMRTSSDKKKCTLFLICAELFAPHAANNSQEMFRGVPAEFAPEFKECIKWAITASHDSRWAQ